MGSSSHNQEKVSMVVMGCALVGAALGWLFVPVTKTVQDTADEATDAGHTAISFRSCMSDCTGENDSDDDTVDCFFDCAVLLVQSLAVRLLLMCSRLHCTDLRVPCSPLRSLKGHRQLV